MAASDHTSEGMSCRADSGLDKLREAGFRLTSQRKAILAVFEGGPEHLTPQQIYGRLQDSVPSLSLATVYNTLELFEDVGLVGRFNGHDGQTYFDPTLEPHHHAVCNHCGEIFDVKLADETIQQLISTSQTLHTDEADFVVENATVWLRGACKACR